MLKRKWLVTAAVVLVSSSMLIAADEMTTPATQPAETKAGHTHKTRLIKPYSELTGLTEDQKTQIEKIHAETIKEEKELHAKEESAVEAILTDDQKAQLKTLDEKPAPPKMPKHKKGEPTTEPTK